MHSTAARQRERVSPYYIKSRSSIVLCFGLRLGGGALDFILEFISLRLRLATGTLCSLHLLSVRNSSRTKWLSQYYVTQTQSGLWKYKMERSQFLRFVSVLCSH